MVKITVDARGLACPQPVVMTKQALDELAEGEIIVLVDSENPRDNVIRLARNQGCEASAADKDGGYAVTITKKAGSAAALHPEPIVCSAASQDIVYLFDSDYVGSNLELGKVLTNGFLNASLSLPHTKGAVILISNAVRLAISGSYALEVLAKVKDKGLDILLCGTCLDFFKIRDKVEIGTVSNALEIMERMTGAAKIVKF